MHYASGTSVGVSNGLLALANALGGKKRAGMEEGYKIRNVMARAGQLAQGHSRGLPSYAQLSETTN